MADPLPQLTTALSDRYRIERELGAGGMATVYLAHDLRHDRKVAHQGAAPGARRGDRRRAVPLRDQDDRESAASAHPAAASIRARPTAFLFYVMPFVEGESLRDRLDREKQLPVADAVRIATRGGRRARLRAPPRRHPPRHQAREHPAARRQRAGRRLRHRARRQQGGRRADDRDRDVARHAALHEPRAGDGRARDRRAQPTSTRSAACSTRCCSASRPSPGRRRRPSWPR